MLLGMTEYRLEIIKQRRTSLTIRNTRMILIFVVRAGSMPILQESALTSWRRRIARIVHFHGWHNQRDMSIFLRTAASLIDVIGIPIYIEWFIWRGQFAAPRSWIGFPIW